MFIQNHKTKNKIKEQNSNLKNYLMKNNLLK